MLKRIPDYDLLPRNTFRMKAKCTLYIEYDSVKDLEELDFDALPRPLLSIGEGSNLLFTRDFPGTVLCSKIAYLKFFDLGLDEVPVAAGAGVKFDDLCARMCAEGLWGLENLSLIPGTAGAAAVQNIGAYGVEFKDIASGVSCFDIEKRCKCSFKVEECAYGYRDSFFKRPENKERYIITGVLLRLSRKAAPRLDYGALRSFFPEGDPVSPQEVRDAVIRTRREKLPDPLEIGSAGSFFKNPVVPKEHYEAIVAAEGVTVPHYDLPDGSVKIPAAWMIDRLGFKGRRLGGAAVHEKQPLVLINVTGDAPAADILALEKEICDAVEQRFGIRLHPEVEHL